MLRMDRLSAFRSRIQTALVVAWLESVGRPSLAM